MSTATETKHTPTPWKPALTAADTILDAKGNKVLCVNTGAETDFSTTARIVQCVNACEGVQDPAEALRLAKEALIEANHDEVFAADVAIIPAQQAKHRTKAMQYAAALKALGV